MARNKKVYIAFAVVLAAMAYLIFGGFNQQTMVYYSTVKELKEQGSQAYGRGFRVSGKVVPGSVQVATDRVRASFDIEEEGEVLHVVYDGVLPDTFKENIDVLVEGKMAESGTFQAANVFTKCASKYAPAEENDSAAAQKTGTN